MSIKSAIKSAVLAVVLGVVAAAAAQAQPVVNVSFHTGPTRVAPAHAMHPGWQPVREPGRVQGHYNHHKPRHQSRIQVGQRLTRDQLRHARHVNWRRAGLRAPARAQQWVHLQGRYVLVNMNSSRVVRMSR